MHVLKVACTVYIMWLHACTWVKCLFLHVLVKEAFEMHTKQKKKTEHAGPGPGSWEGISCCTNLQILALKRTKIPQLDVRYELIFGVGLLGSMHGSGDIGSTLV